MDLQRNAARHLNLGTLSDPHTAGKWSDLLDSSFDVPKGSRFLDDFPVWDPSIHVPGVYRLGYFQGEQLVSAAAVRLAKLKGLRSTDSDIPCVAIIGGVSTLPEWRGQGLASRLVSTLTQWAKGNGAFASFLWGSEHRMYQNLGYELCGRQARIPLQVFESSQIELGLKIEWGWNRGIFDLLKKRKGGLSLAENDLTWIESHKNIQWVFISSNEIPIAYAAFGRGIDLAGMVHEWGGNKLALRCILNYLYKNGLAKELLGPPQLLEELQIQIEPQFEEYHCLAKVLNSSALFKNIGSNIDLGHLSSLSDREQVQTIFGGPEWASSSQVGFLPIPIWFWGVDGA